MYFQLGNKHDTVQNPKGKIRFVSVGCCCSHGHVTGLELDWQKQDSNLVVNSVSIQMTAVITTGRAEIAYVKNGFRSVQQGA